MNLKTQAKRVLQKIKPKAQAFNRFFDGKVDEYKANHTIKARLAKAKQEASDRAKEAKIKKYDSMHRPKQKKQTEGIMDILGGI